jgi:hypothetical protein
MDTMQVALPQEEHRTEFSPASANAYQKPELLPLDAAERTIVFRSGGKPFRHIFRRITAADWENFFAHVVAEFKREKGGFMQVVDMDYASLVLYARAIVRVEGYQTRDGRAPETLPTWPECVPQHHRLAAMGLIMNVTHAEAADDSMLEAEGVAVTIDAMWNEETPRPLPAWNEGAPGPHLSAGASPAMKQYRGLVHRFASPTAEHRRRLLKAKNRAFVAGGSRNGTTVIPSGHGVLVKLYDELIECVDGYAVGGREIASHDEIIREMDAFHKSAVVARLFQSSTGIDEDGAESE